MIHHLTPALEACSVSALRALGVRAWGAETTVEIHTPDGAILHVYTDDDGETCATVTPRRGPWPPDLRGAETIAQELLDRGLYGDYR